MAQKAFRIALDQYPGDSRAETKVPIGQFGAREIQYFNLDEKLLSSALVVGKTGSGKSTLLHILIHGLAFAYSPEELELYLLDFKQVEFMDYALHRLPHARVVAVKSEREFGLSVLRGLDAIGVDHLEPQVQQAAEWIRMVQNADGGWGETCGSYDDPDTRGVGPSTPSQTAWGLLGLHR